jgi:hypothetical protein
MTIDSELDVERILVRILRPIIGSYMGIVTNFYYGMHASDERSQCRGCMSGGR